DTREQRAAILQGLAKTVEVDPEYARAWAFLAIMHCDEVRTTFQSSPADQETLARAGRAVQRALHLAPHSAMTHFALAIVRLQLGDPTGCEAAARRSIDAIPLNPKILMVLGNRLWEMGRFEEGVALTRRAVAL